MKPLHPAKFSESIIALIGELLDEHLPGGGRILDPFAGTGLVHEFADVGRETVGIEIEPEWAEIHPRTIVGNALALPFDDDSFAAVITSPAYGNRFADSHRAKDGSRRRSYTHDMRAMTGDPDRVLHPDNAGTLHWSPKYRTFHAAAWAEARRVLAPGGLFILNISDHVRAGQVQPVTRWHLEHLTATGFVLIDERTVETPRLRHGANGKARVDHETVAVLRNDDEKETTTCRT